MCAFLIPAIIGVAALGLVGGVGGGGSNTEITIPQQVGQGTNVIAVASPQYSYAQPQQPYANPQQQMAYAPQPGYGQQQYAPQPAGYGAPYGQNGVGASVGVNGQSAIGAGAYANPNDGVGVGANIGGVDASIGLGARNY